MRVCIFACGVAVVVVVSVQLAGIVHVWNVCCWVCVCVCVRVCACTCVFLHLYMCVRA